MPVPPVRPRPSGWSLQLTRAAALLVVAGCARTATVVPAPSPTPDPRVGLKAGLTDAGEAIWNLGFVSNVPSPPGFQGVSNSDLAFRGNYAIQGNYNGFNVWDITNPKQPQLVKSNLCPASQSDVSVYKHLLFVSAEGLSGRTDCGTQGVQDTVSAVRMRGIRVYDATNIADPKYIASVQTCRGSHTHTVVEDPRDKENVYIYVSGSAGVRSPNELPGCSGMSPENDPNSSLFRIEVIQVPMARPQDAKVINSARIFEGLTAPARHADVMTAEDSARMAARMRTMPARPPRPAPMRGGGPTQCHDITVYPAIGLAGGACEGYGLLLDITDPVNPRRLDAVADSNFAYWHSATFNNDGTKVLFSDEWGGGGAPKCRASDPREWGANAIFTIENGRMRFASYYKLPAVQTSLENCVAHNGSLIPIPGRDVMVQAWYQGGISVFDWTDASNPYEIAFHDRGPVSPTEMGNAGSWSVYWYNGAIVSSEMGRGLDVFQLTPSAHVSQNEIDAANTVRLGEFNAQGQPRFVWPPSFALARAYVDQMERSGAVPAARIAALRQELAQAEGASGAARTDALTGLAARLDGEAGASRDAAKVRMLAGAVRELAAAR
jgi:hypothetical protein